MTTEQGNTQKSNSNESSTQKSDTKKSVKKKKEIETFTVSHWESTSLDFISPARCKYYIKDALGDFIYVKTSKRNLAQERIDEMYGEGKYKVRQVIKAEIR